jgi:hypothetical protein
MRPRSPWCPFRPRASVENRVGRRNVGPPTGRRIRARAQTRLHVRSKIAGRRRETRSPNPTLLHRLGRKSTTERELSMRLREAAHAPGSETHRDSPSSSYDSPARTRSALIELTRVSLGAAPRPVRRGASASASAKAASRASLPIAPRATARATSIHRPARSRSQATATTPSARVYFLAHKELRIPSAVAGPARSRRCGAPRASSSA